MRVTFRGHVKVFYAKPTTSDAWRKVWITTNHRDVADRRSLQNLFKITCELSEGCISNYGVFSESGREELFNSLKNKNLAELECCVVLYTCCPYSFLIGVLRDSFFLIDTRAVREAVDGNEKGILVYTRDRSILTCKMFVWLSVNGIRSETTNSVSWLTECVTEGKSSTSELSTRH